MWWHLLYIIPISLFFVWMYFVNRRDKEMQSNLSLGDPVYFYIGEVKYRGNFVKQKDNGVFVVRIGPQLNYVNNIYAVLTHKYANNDT